jgi:hypothetical protein
VATGMQDKDNIHDAWL